MISVKKYHTERVIDVKEDLISQFKNKLFSKKENKERRESEKSQTLSSRYNDSTARNETQR